MPKETGRDGTNDLADALVAGVKAAQQIRRAGRRKIVGMAKDAAHTTERVLGAIAEL